MRRHELRVTDAFIARSAAGIVQPVWEYTEFNCTSAAGKPEVWLPGLKELRLQGGEYVADLPDGRLEVVKYGEILKRIG